MCQKRVFPFLKLELQGIVSHLAWVVGTKLKFRMDSFIFSFRCSFLEWPTLLLLSLIYFTVRLWEIICVCPRVQCTCTCMCMLVHTRGQHGCFPQLLSILFSEGGPLIKPEEALILLHCLASKPRTLPSSPSQE